jgi:exosortase family protein XrtM
MLVRAVVFFVAFAALHLAWESTRGGRLEWLVVHNGVVQPATQLINALTPAVRAQASRFSILSPGGGINILNGCEGVDTLLLLLAAILAAQAPWRARLSGALWGALLVFAANQLRVLTLFYAYRADHALFHTLHTSVTPVILVLIVCVYFHVWLSRPAARPQPAT